jgi:hypothetical protein
LLGFNRFLDLLDKKQASKFFDGRKTYYWMLIPFLIGGYFTLFPKAFLLNSKLGSLFNNPFAAEPDIIVNPKDVRPFRGFWAGSGLGKRFHDFSMRAIDFSHRKTPIGLF